MLIRVVLENIFSFGKRREFNMFPGNSKTFPEHKYKFNDIELLKMSSIYGANASGKSNLIKSVKILQNLVLKDKSFNINFDEIKNKFSEENSNIIIGIEYTINEKAFIYAIEFSKTRIATEELYLSGLNKKDDKLLFERKTNPDGSTTLLLAEEIENTEKNKILKSLLIEEFIKPDRPAFETISVRNQVEFKQIKLAFSWFENFLFILSPDSLLRGISNVLSYDHQLKNMISDFFKRTKTGIIDIEIKETPLEEYFDIEDTFKEITDLVNNSRNNILFTKNKFNEEVTVVKENDNYIVKSLNFIHKGTQQDIEFSEKNESDGTIKILHLMPAILQILFEESVFFIDEIERSIHPMLIKELINIFSKSASKGQLIFTTHESNLLDLKIFRQDEIWFTEKDIEGNTDLYPLSEFKEHHTKDIRKGYLNGRYGAIPFLSNINDLQWMNYAVNQ